MRLLVLGANGQLGGDLMAAAAARGIDATGAGRETLDIADPEALRGYLATAAFDALVNCAAALNTEAIEGDPAPAMAINAHAPAVMAEAAAAKGARFLQVSTDYVFGGDAARAAPLTEADPPAPVNVYGASKLLGETLARLAGGDVTVFRVASTFGVRGASGKGGNFVETMIRMGRERGKLTVVADQVMSPTATAWAADAILDFLDPRRPARASITRSTPAPCPGSTSPRPSSPRPASRPRSRPARRRTGRSKARRPACSALDNARLAAVIGPIPGWEAALDGYLAAKGHV